MGQGKKLELWAENLWVDERDDGLAERVEEVSLPDELVSLSL